MSCELRLSSLNCTIRSVVFASIATTGLLSLDTTILSSLVDRGSRVLNVILGRCTNNERGDVNHLFADSNVSLEDEDTSVMDRLCEVALHDEGLETSFHELRDGQTKYIIELTL